MVTTSDITSIDGYAAMTPQEIADALNAMPVTRTPIDLDYLLFLLNNRSMLVRLIRPADAGEKWTGTVVTMITYVNDNVPMMAGPVNQWFSHITNDRNRTFDTTIAEYGSQLKLLANQFGGQEGMPTADDFAAIVELGGGWRYDGVTAADVSDAIELARLTNAKALFGERMTVGGDADAVWSQAWSDSEAA